MTSYNTTLTDFVAGDDFTIERTVTALPSGVVLSKVWFTVKKKYTDTDSNALIQKAITTVNQPGIGIIDNINHFYIYLSPTDTELLNPTSEYFYDIQLKLSDTSITTPEFGTIIALPQVTKTRT